jgi:putative MATE family efflux protein
LMAGHLFSNKELKKLILPLFMEQLLVMLVGIADTFVVSYAEEAAVSGVSLVNSFNTIFIYLFTALASGGAVIISQYIGRHDTEPAGESASQLFTVSLLFSAAAAVVILMLHRQILRLMFGKVEPEVMEACVTYLRISAYSYPAIAVYNAGAAVYRSVGKTSTTMYISVLSNIINVIGNVIGVFVLNAGVAGVAYPSLAARMFSAVVITGLCFRKRERVQYRLGWILQWNRDLMRRILGIAVPNGIENGIFQFVKVALSSVAALFGTYQIAANGIAQSIWSMAALAGVTMGPVFITVIGQCMGAGDSSQAEYYFKKLLKITLLLSLIWNAMIFAVTPLLMKAYILADETKRLVILLVLIHNVFNSIVFPFSGPLGNGLRAAGDVKFTMVVSIASTIGGRLIFSLLFGIVFQMGVIGIACAMCLDWLLRAIIFYVRFKAGKWKCFKVI